MYFEKKEIILLYQKKEVKERKRDSSSRSIKCNPSSLIEQ